MNRTVRIAAPIALLLAAQGCAVNPATGKAQLSLIGEDREIAIGKESRNEIVASVGLVDDPGLQAYVSRIGTSIASRSERPDLPWSFEVLDDAAVNAFALPGGPIFVTRGILAHLRSEAELASVLGHEVGHVTARHSVNRLSKTSLLQGTLGIGMIVLPELQRFGDLASTGLGLLFLKYSRDDERQSDELGFRYAVSAGYDPSEAADVFRVLEGTQRLAGGGKLPGWLATHPDPANRAALAERRASSSSAGGRIEEAAYLGAVDGIVFGEDPRKGYFDGTTFHHPDLAFRIELPEGWKTRNASDSVSAGSPEGKAAVVLRLSSASSVAAAADAFFEQAGVSRGRPFTDSIAGLPTASSEFRVARDGGDLEGLAAFVEHGGRVYGLLGFASTAEAAEHRGAIERSLASFRRETDPQVLGARPDRLEIVTIDRPTTIEAFDRDRPSAIGIAHLALINGVRPGETIPAGTRLKRVAGGAWPGRDR